jgi:hypothetical protein
MCSFIEKFSLQKILIYSESLHADDKHKLFSISVIHDILKEIYLEYPDLIYIIFDSLLRSQPSKVHDFNNISTSISQKFIPYILILYSSGVDVDAGIFKYVTSMLAPVKIITGENYINNIYNFSKDIISLNESSGGFYVYSGGHDPYFSIAPLDVSKCNNFYIVVSVNSPEQTVMQLFYQTKREPFHGNTKCINKVIYEGDNLVIFVGGGEDFNGVLRLDIGDKIGGYFIKYLSITTF